MENLHHAKAKIYHHLRQIQVFLIDVFETNIELEELYYKIMKVNDQAIAAT